MGGIHIECIRYCVKIFHGLWKMPCVIFHNVILTRFAKVFKLHPPGVHSFWKGKVSTCFCIASCKTTPLKIYMEPLKSPNWTGKLSSKPQFSCSMSVFQSVSFLEALDHNNKRVGMWLFPPNHSHFATASGKGFRIPIYHGIEVIIRRDPGSPSENGFMEPKYIAFRRWLDTPIINISSTDVRWVDW